MVSIAEMTKEERKEYNRIANRLHYKRKIMGFGKVKNKHWYSHCYYLKNKKVGVFEEDIKDPYQNGILKKNINIKISFD